MRRCKIIALCTLGILIALAVPQVQAQRPVECGCYCGKITAPPCSASACMTVCGYNEPQSGISVPDYEARRRAEEQARQQREADERMEAQRLEAERKRQFEAERDAAARSLKGLPPVGDTGSFGLRGVTPPAAELRASHAPVARDLAGRHAAWKQIHCAASILTPALAALTPPGDRPADFNEYRYLAGEALNCLLYTSPSPRDS